VARSSWLEPLLAYQQLVPDLVGAPVHQFGEATDMLTGELKSQIDRIWDAFWSGGISNPLEVIEQITDPASTGSVLIELAELPAGHAPHA
jgi:hypothetical protein